MDKKDAASIIAPPFMSLTKLGQQHLTPIKLHNQLCGMVTKFLLRKGWRYQIGWIFGGFLVGVALDWIYFQIYNASTAPSWGKILIPMFVECCPNKKTLFVSGKSFVPFALKLKCYRSPSLLVPFKIFFLLHFFFLSDLSLPLMWSLLKWRITFDEVFHISKAIFSTLLNILVLYKKKFAKTSSVSRGIVHEFFYSRDSNPILSTVSSISISRNSSDTTSTD